jgi:hypothetical protein
MKASFARFVFPVVLVAGAALGHAQITITNNSSAAGQPSYDFGPVVVSAFLGDTAVTPNALINSNNLQFLGVLSTSGNVNSINDADGAFGGVDQERLRLTLDSGYGLSAFDWAWTRADGPLTTDGISISGFLADPGATFSGGITGTPFYSAGVLNFQVAGADFSGTVRTVSFANLAASDGASLEIVVADSTQAGPQLTPRSFTVAVVPEPSAFALLGLGAVGLLGMRRRIV